MALRKWKGVLVTEGVQSGDGRAIAEGACYWVEPPIPLAWITEGDQHVYSDAAPTIGNVQTIARVGNDVTASGIIDDEIEEGGELIRMLDAGSAPLGDRVGLSIDADDWEIEVVLMDAEEAQEEGMILLASAAPARNWPDVKAMLAPLMAAAGDPDPGPGGGENGVTIFEDSADSIIERATRLRIRGVTACAVEALVGSYLMLDGAEGEEAETVEDESQDDGEAMAASVTIDNSTLRLERDSEGRWIVTGQQSAAAPVAASLNDDGFIGGNTISEYPISSVTPYDQNSSAWGTTTITPNITITTPAGGPESTAAEVIRRLDGGAPVIAHAAVDHTPPDEFFNNPNLAEPQRWVSITDDGRIFGHLATDGECHIGILDQCVTLAMLMAGGFDYAQPGYTVAASGRRIGTMPLTVKGGHANLRDHWRAAQAHYDDPSAAVADVAVGMDLHGVWFSGAVRPEASPEAVHALRASGVSGDWRPIGGALRLVGACCVNVPGYPKAQARVACGEIVALVAAGGRPLPAPSCGCGGSCGCPGSSDEELAARVAAVEDFVRPMRVKALKDKMGFTKLREDRLAELRGRMERVG